MKENTVLVDRGAVEINTPDGNLYLYTHKNARYIIADVHAVLSRELYWNYDESDYLAKMIFMRMVPPEEHDKIGGFGISINEYPDLKIFVQLDVKNQLVYIYENDMKVPEWGGTYTRFVKDYYSLKDVKAVL
jgi:hypothetical protein